MITILPLHIVAGILALAFGYVALFASKGASIHRRAGTGFVIAMGVMSLTGALVATIKWERGSIIEGKARIKRHLWRLCFAMWVAAASFFWGPQNRIPEIIRIPALLPIPVLMPVAVMIFWLWRLRAKKPIHPAVTLSQVHPLVNPS